jgi:hypothetical protein
MYSGKIAVPPGGGGIVNIECVLIKEMFFQASIKEGYLLKQTWSFQRWRRRYFKLKGRKLYYAKDTKVSFNILCFLLPLYRFIINDCPIAVGVENPHKFGMCR